MIIVPDAKYIRKITGFKTKCVKSTDSTFDDIGSYDAIIARAQKHGVGRGDHSFASPPGGVYLVMRELSLSIERLTLTPSVGLAVHDTILAVLGLETSLKWVNDVFYDGKKVCGILCRSPRRGEYTIGVGINYSTAPFALENAGLDASTLFAPEDKITQFCTELIRRIHLYALSPFDCTRYNKLCMNIGKNISFMRDGMTVKGFATGVDTDGALLVKIGAATVAVDAGEVSIIRDEEEPS